MSNMENPNWGTPLRGVNGRGPGDYSTKVGGSSYTMPQQKLGVNPAQTEKYDPHNTQQRFQSPAYTSFVRKGLSRPGYVPTVEDF